MSFIFNTRPAPKRSASRRMPVSTTSLHRIEEDNTASYEAPPVPARSEYRPPRNRIFGSEDSPPPPYKLAEPGVDDPKGEKLAGLRRDVLNNKQIAKRGGWTRVCLIGIILSLLIVGLVVGLVVGLRHRSSSTSPSSGATSGSGAGNPATSTVFPAGSYSIATYLSSVEANCTTNPATWTCFPYTTYSQNPLQSNATFQWIIDPVPHTPNTYTISTSANPFSIFFTNVSLTLTQAGTANEHYFFRTPLPKVTVPTAPLLSGQNVAATCYFNQTTFQGALYTQLPRSFPDNSTTKPDPSVPFGAWPYQVKIDQISDAGEGTPTCLGAGGEAIGDFSVRSGGGLCDCLYMNTGT